MFLLLHTSHAFLFACRQRVIHCILRRRNKGAPASTNILPAMQTGYSDIQFGVVLLREICYRGRHIMMGYLANPSLGEEHVAEIEKKTADAIDAEGWLHSADKGCVVRSPFMARGCRDVCMFRACQSLDSCTRLFTVTAGRARVFSYHWPLQGANHRGRR